MDEPLAFFVVKQNSANIPVNIASITTSEGRKYPIILPEDIIQQQEVNFKVGTMLTKYIAPQFEIDDELYNIDVVRGKNTAKWKTANEWRLLSPMNYFHPFHIHVNPFMVKGVFTSFLPGAYLRSVVTQEETSFDQYPPELWRDTIFIPPFGETVIWQRFDAPDGLGKTVFHCHFLDHEDQGMITNFMIEKKPKYDSKGY